MTTSGRKWAFLSNCLTSAIESEGSIDWFPCPKFDSPSIFSKILDDRTGGYFSVKPDADYKLVSSYVGDSLVLRNTFTTSKGKLEVTDALPIGLSGIIRIYDSKVPFTVDINPLFGYGLTNASIDYVDNGLIFKNTSSQEGLEVSITGKHTVVDEGIIRFFPGKGNIFTVYSKDLRYGIFSNKGFVYPEPRDALNKAIDYWHDQIMLAKEINMYNDAYKRSIATVLGLMYQPSGAIVAAPTTSLPEIVGMNRNWDYRYLWIRDASYAAEALANIGHLAKSRRIIDFMLAVIDPSSKSFDHPLYTIDGTPPPPEETMGWLNGHLGSRPVRVGNAAYMQLQMDVEGAFMNALYTYLMLTESTEYAVESWWAIESIVQWTKDSWDRESTSIWEERQRGQLIGETRRHYVHTKVMEWVAVDRAAKIAQMIGYSEKAKEWETFGNRLRDYILKKGVSAKSGGFVKYYGANEVDASLLTLPLYGFIDAKDKRFVATLKRIEKDLMIEPGLLLRYKHDFLGKDIMRPFTLPSTWLARVYMRMGDSKKANAVIKKLISCSTDLLFFGEHLEPKTWEPRGNFPQLFPHAGLLMALAEYDNPELYNM